MAKRDKRASWFKLFLHQKPIMDAVSDAELGRAMKAALQYFDTGEICTLGTLESVVFLCIKPYIDEAQVDYLQKVENGKKGGRPKANTKPEVSTPYERKPEQTEADTEADTETNAEALYISAQARNAYTSFHPPTCEDVRSYCKQKGYTVDPESFVDYYTCNGWRVGKNPMRDWKAALRCWNRKEHPNEKTEHKSAWHIGTQL